MQSTSQDSYYRNGTDSMEGIRATGSGTQSQSHFDQGTNNSNLNGFQESSTDGYNAQDEYDQQQEGSKLYDSFQDEESYQQQSTSRPAKKSKPSTVFGGSKRKRTKGRKAAAAAIAASNAESQQALAGEAQADANQKPGLASLQRPLLALDVPKISEFGELTRDDVPTESKLYLRDDDKRKLQVVISR